jgi:predicted anti-sigma-YlaC factor YlaD
MTEHIDPASALALAALPEHAPERRGAWEHAAQCSACRALLDEGLAMLSMIDAESVPPSVGTALKARVKTAVFARAHVRSRRDRWALALVALVSLLLAVFDGQLGRPLALGVGVHCLVYEMALGMVPVGVMLLLARRNLAELRPLRVGALAAGFALIGQLLLRARCPVHDAALHLLLFHVSGVVLVAFLGIRSVRWLPRLG